MTHRLKSVGLAIAAVLALSVVVASSASAAAFHSEVESTKISASQTTTHKFTSTAGEVTCEKATFSGTQTTKTSHSITITPNWSGCHIIIFGSTISATIDHKGCNYTFDSTTGEVDLLCPVNAEITVSGAGCTIKVPAQENLKSVTYKNNGNHIDITASLSGIKYSHSGFTCGTGSGTNGTYSGTATASGTDTAGKPVKIWYE